MKAAIALLLAVMAAAMFASVLDETQTWDEGGHLTAGYIFLTTGRTEFYTEHPPLRSIYALPLLFMRLRLPTGHFTWREGNKTDFATQFLYTNRYHPDTLLLAGRSVAIALTLAFGVVLAWWTWRRFGPPAAVFATLLFAFDPNLIAHGRYITTDMLAAFTFFLAVIAWGAYLEKPGPRRLAWAGVALGLALLAKFSAVLLGPIFVLLCSRHIVPFPSRDRKGAVASLAAVGAIAALIVALFYHAPLSLAHPYLTGLSEVVAKNSSGHASYLLGMHSQQGWWYYFPVVFAVKTPLAVLALLAVAAWSRPRGAALVAVPAAAYFAFSMTSAINLGVRHLLPVYPLLYVLLAASVMRLPRRAWIAWAAAALLIVESAAIYPHYLAFFNAASGGPRQGPRYLLDSNIDWGQDVKRLRSWLRARHIDSPCMFYFGNTGVEFYGIPMRHLPRTWELEARRHVDCVAAISVTALYDMYVPPGSYAWLREKEPVARIGWSIYVYDFRKKPVK